MDGSESGAWGRPDQASQAPPTQINMRRSLNTRPTVAADDGCFETRARKRPSYAILLVFGLDH